MYRRIRRIEIQNPICVVERVSRRKTDRLKYTVVQSSGRVVEHYRGKRTKPKRLDGASMRDPSLNLPQGGEIDNRPRLNQPHSQAPPE
jgi:hypothetical protein